MGGRLKRRGLQGGSEAEELKGSAEELEGAELAVVPEASG